MNSGHIYEISKNRGGLLNFEQSNIIKIDVIWQNHSIVLDWNNNFWIEAAPFIGAGTVNRNYGTMPSVNSNYQRLDQSTFKLSKLNFVTSKQKYRPSFNFCEVLLQENLL